MDERKMESLSKNWQWTIWNDRLKLQDVYSFTLCIYEDVA